MMELEARILDYSGNEIDGYFYATEDVEQAMAESISRARMEIDEFDSIEIVPFNGEYRTLAVYDAEDDEIAYYC